MSDSDEYDKISDFESEEGGNDDGKDAAKIDSSLNKIGKNRKAVEKDDESESSDSFVLYTDDEDSSLSASDSNEDTTSNTGEKKLQQTTNQKMKDLTIEDSVKTAEAKAPKPKAQESKASKTEYLRFMEEDRKYDLDTKLHEHITKLCSEARRVASNEYENTFDFFGVKCSSAKKSKSSAANVSSSSTKYSKKIEQVKPEVSNDQQNPDAVNEVYHKMFLHEQKYINLQIQLAESNDPTEKLILEKEFKEAELQWINSKNEYDQLVKKAEAAYATTKESVVQIYDSSADEIYYDTVDSQSTTKTAEAAASSSSMLLNPRIFEHDLQIQKAKATMQKYAENYSSLKIQMYQQKDKNKRTKYYKFYEQAGQRWKKSKKEYEKLCNEKMKSFDLNAGPTVTLSKFESEKLVNNSPQPPKEITTTVRPSSIVDDAIPQQIAESSSLKQQTSNSTVTSKPAAVTSNTVQLTPDEITNKLYDFLMPGRNKLSGESSLQQQPSVTPTLAPKQNINEQMQAMKFFHPPSHEEQIYSETLPVLHNRMLYLNQMLINSSIEEPQKIQKEYDLALTAYNALGACKLALLEDLKKEENQSTEELILSVYDTMNSFEQQYKELQIQMPHIQEYGTAEFKAYFTNACNTAKSRWESLKAVFERLNRSKPNPAATSSTELSSDNDKKLKNYHCEKCQSYLTTEQQIASSLFNGALGSAILYSKIENVKHGETYETNLMTGKHFVKDVYCKKCNRKLGWFYESAAEEEQKYKEGKTVLEKVLLQEVAVKVSTECTNTNEKMDSTNAKISKDTEMEVDSNPESPKSSKTKEEKSVVEMKYFVEVKQSPLEAMKCIQNAYAAALRLQPNNDAKECENAKVLLERIAKIQQRFRKREAFDVDGTAMKRSKDDENDKIEEHIKIITFKIQEKDSQ
uniref:Yippee domain-containing protein n=1 Tax=Panagrolaimus davidi TaxID=227884 RepID=A0A914QIU2_9BILA